jgi:PGF-pre-PGF domain-containing protein
MLGTNIVGGDYIGGNYWGFLNATGFSETCTDSDGDDICDSYYDLGDGNYDYLPLRLISIILPALPGDSGPTIITGSSSGIITTLPPRSSETNPIKKVSAGGSTSVSIKSPAIDIRTITLSVSEDIKGGASLTVERTDSGNFQIQLPFGNIYQAFTITTKAITNEQLNNVTIDFRVNKTWLAEQNASYENVGLYRIPTNESLWESLPTSSIREDDEYYYFSSVSPGFSTFVVLIHEEVIGCEENQIRCFNKEVQICSDGEWVSTKTCLYKCDNGKCVSFIPLDFNFIIIYSLVGFLLIVIFVSYLIRRKKLSDL